MKTQSIKNEKHTARLCSQKSEKECTAHLSAVEDALFVIGGKWKLKLIIALRTKGSMRFNELQRTIDGISAKVLSNELKDLELNGFVRRNIYTQTPVVTEYELTEYADSLGEVMETLVTWGTAHRAKVRRELTK